VRGNFALSDRWTFSFEGDIGGFGVVSDLTWQAYAGFGWSASPSLSLGIGYRGLGTDYSKGDFSYDTVTQGPMVGFLYSF